MQDGQEPTKTKRANRAWFYCSLLTAYCSLEIFYAQTGM